MLTAAAGKEISKEEGEKPLMPSSTTLRLWVCGRRRQTVPSDIITQNVAT